MEKQLTLVQNTAAAGVFSAISFWDGFNFGRESAWKELSGLIDDLKCKEATSSSPDEASSKT